MLEQFLAALNQSGIRYVHFKSSEHLADNFTGDSDFDVLVDPRDGERFQRAMQDAGMKRFEPVRYGIYPGVQNWLLHDAKTGLIHHFHVHFRMASGTELYKDYLLPWDQRFLDRRRLHAQHPLYIADPHDELILLLARAVIKAKRVGPKVPGGMLREFRDLLGQVSPEGIADSAAAMLKTEAARDAAMAIVRKGDLALGPLVRPMREELETCRRASAPMARLHGLALRVKRRYDRTLARRFYYPIAKKRPDRGGLLIAFIGVDGSGKSTVSKQSAQWLGKKVECRQAYLGSGRELGGRAIKLVRLVHGALPGKCATAGPLRAIRDGLRALLYALTARRQRKRITKLRRYTLNGGVAITDRYPQLQSPGLNDGLKLADWAEHRSPWIRWCAAKERQSFESMLRIQPDIVIRMNLSAETSMRRHPEQTQIAQYEKKIRDLSGLRFEQSIVYDVDAEQPLDEVTKVVRALLWAAV